jgi:hypothetical protein
VSGAAFQLAAPSRGVCRFLLTELGFILAWWLASALQLLLLLGMVLLQSLRLLLMLLFRLLLSGLVRILLR